jgi:hypothetical protein
VFVRRRHAGSIFCRYHSNPTIGVLLWTLCCSFMGNSLPFCFPFVHSIQEVETEEDGIKHRENHNHGGDEERVKEIVEEKEETENLIQEPPTDIHN